MKLSVAKVVVCGILLVCWFFMPNVGFLDGDTSSTAAVVGHFLYPFGHANVWHLSANVLCLLLIPCALHLGSSYFVAVVCSFLPCFISESTSGFSGVLFAVIGQSWGRVGRFRDMLWKNKWWLVIPIFIPHVNALLHIWCLLGGFLVGFLVRNNIAPHWAEDWI